MNPTKYEKASVRVLTSLGEYITLTKISGEIPAYLEVDQGLVFKKHVDPTLTATVKTETISALSPLAAAAGSWQSLPPLKFLNIDISPSDAVPLLITYETVRIMLPGFDFDKKAGGAVEWDIKMFPGNIKINGVNLLDGHGSFGI